MRVVLRIALVIVVSIVLTIGGAVLWFYSGFGLPKLSSLSEYKSAQNSKVFASDNTLLAELTGDENREVIPLEEIPDYMRQAVIAIEDSDFYRHKGINWKAVIRALWANVVKGDVVQGGSTITQQYVKNAYVGTKRTLWRKIQEANLAYQLEKKYSKAKIMELYLNDIYFGQRCYGIYTAARKFFGKSPKDLSLAECASLAGVIRSPSYYDPYKQPQAVLERRNLVLDRMRKQGFIKKEEADQAKAEPINLAPPNQVEVARRAPFYCDYITDLIKKTYGDQMAFRGGLRVYTTLDMRLQDLAEKTVSSLTRQDSGPSAALVCLDPRTGYIKAMVGGKNFQTSQYNVAAQGHRQAGSAFKVFVLARMLADGVSPGRTYDSSSPKIITLPDGQKWKVSNYSGGGMGRITVESATIHSVNVVYAQMIMDVGAKRVAEMARQMGIMTEIEANPAIALGGLHIGVTPLEMASAYGTLANTGVHAVPRSIYKVTDAEGNLITENKPEVNRVLDEKVAVQANKILQKVVASGTGTGARIGRPQAGKTGTTEDHADAWFVGYTPDLVTAVWVGYPEGRISMGGMAGGNLPATIWRNFMSQALKDTPPTAFPTAEGIEFVEEDTEEEGVTVLICDETGLLANEFCPSKHEQTFKNGEEPKEHCNVHIEEPKKAVPNVVGMSESSARALLENAGYTVTVVKQSSNQVASGVVISQTPAAGTQFNPGGSVTVIVSTGPSKSTVPSVVGLSEAAARSKLEASGFKASVSYTSGVKADVVISQSPAPGVSLPAGSIVAITVTRASGTGYFLRFLGLTIY